MRLTWRVEGARWARIDPEIGEVGDAGTCEVCPRESGVYTLTAGSRGGDTLAERVYVRVMPFPELRTLLVPAPELSHTVLLRGIHIAAPTLRLGAPTVRIGAPALRMEAPTFNAPLAVDLTVRFAEPVPPRLPDPPPAPPAPPDAAGARGTAWVPRIGHVFDQLYGRIQSELNSRFGGKP